VKRTATGVTGLDQILDGGLEPGAVVVVAGAPGTGKTILAQQICFACGVPEICPACELRRCATRQRQAMMIARVPPSALPDLHPGLRLAGPARPLTGVGKRGTAGAAARGRRAAPRPCAAPAGLGRPRGPTAPAAPSAHENDSSGGAGPSIGSYLSQSGAQYFDDFVRRLSGLEQLAVADGYTLTQRVTAFRKVYYDKPGSRRSYPGVPHDGTFDLLIPGSQGHPDAAVMAAAVGGRRGGSPARAERAVHQRRPRRCRARADRARCPRPPHPGQRVLPRLPGDPDALQRGGRHLYRRPGQRRGALPEGLDSPVPRHSDGTRSGAAGPDL
jgi:KaiC